MYILDKRTGGKIEVVIEPVSAKDMREIRKDPNFRFDWGQYKNKEVYKLRIHQDDKVQGLMCIADHADEHTRAIEIELLEVGEENVGKKKKLDRIAGTLIAYACRESLKRGYEGYVFLTPKTKLIKHYAARYYLTFIGPVGFNPVGIMVSEERTARKLIKEYLE